MATALRPAPASLGGPSPGGGYTWTGIRWVKKPKANPQAGIVPYTPFKPLTADQLPPSSYDVGLDAQLRASQRGLGYTEADYGRDNARASDDYQRGLASILQGRTRGTEDTARSTSELARRFGILGRSQNQAARAAGVARGGALAQSFEKRTANQANDQFDIDRSLSRLMQDYDTQQGGLSLGYQRGVEDRGSAIERARAEASAFTGDTAAAKIQQAAQSGFEFPNAPANELRSPSGVTYRIIKGNLGTTWYQLPDGRVTKKKPA